MFRLSTSILHPEPASDVIGLEELGTMSLDNSVNQLSNAINSATWKDSNFSLVNISVYAVVDAAMAIYQPVQRLFPVKKDYNSLSD